MLAHYRAQRSRVLTFLEQHGEESTLRQRGSAWVPCRWRELCREALSCYDQFIRELQDGTYAWSAHAGRLDA